MTNMVAKKISFQSYEPPYQAQIRDKENGKNLGAAVASYIIPGISRVANGDKANGFTRMGIWAGLMAGMGIVSNKLCKIQNQNFFFAMALNNKSIKDYFKVLFHGGKKHLIAMACLGTALIANGVASAIDAYKIKKEA